MRNGAVIHIVLGDLNPCPTQQVRLRRDYGIFSARLPVAVVQQQDSSLLPLQTARVIDDCQTYYRADHQYESGLFEPTIDSG